MHVFAWLSFLVYSCTNNILLYLFTQSVGDDAYRMSPMLIAWINLPSSSKGTAMIQGSPMLRCYLSLCNSLDLYFMLLMVVSLFYYIELCLMLANKT